MRLRVLLAGILAFHAGWYMLVPFFAILFTTRRGLSPAQVGLVLAAQSFALLLGSLAGGALADRLGRRRTMVTGLWLRAAGVAGLGIAPGLGSAFAAAAVAGVGGGLYGPAAKAAIAVLAEAEKGPGREAAFSWRGIAANVGTSSGPLVGTLLVRGPMPVLFGVAAAIHAVLAGVTQLFLPAEQTGMDQQVKTQWRDLFQDTPYLAFSGVTALAWGLFAQLTLAVPLYASQVLGLEASIGLLWTLSSLAVILLQVPVTRHIISRMRPLTAMAVGVALLGAGLGLVGFAGGLAGLLGAVLVFVAGEMLLLPTVDSTVSLLATAGAVGSYFGVASFAWGLGEGLGSLTGGALMQYALATGRVGLPWPIYTGVGLGLGGLFLGLGRYMAARGRLGGPAEVPGAGEGAGAQARTRVAVYRPGYPVPEDEAIRLGPPDEE